MRNIRILESKIKTKKSLPTKHNIIFPRLTPNNHILLISNMQESNKYTSTIHIRHRLLNLWYTDFSLLLTTGVNQTLCLTDVYVFLLGSWRHGVIFRKLENILGLENVCLGFLFRFVNVFRHHGRVWSQKIRHFEVGALRIRGVAFNVLHLCWLETIFTYFFEIYPFVDC